ncbi:hypothetical protein [Fluviicola taffensis]|uniref:Lipoprotein n=1 Tax=Fluviicola taffensis (strain DSM 16823 / NCIMB 13979 / RW262) TaxID=755732 RepID=F2IIC4_FLUTR|nr:hypothetical protein [Fluviicola taffensis]AEA43833.1 hypothetical protein Fluta_1846 [Fluviicola taffensis DSM 16823]
MKGTLLFFITIFIIFLTSCKKEIGKKEYLLQFEFENGHKTELTGKIFEKNKTNKKYKAQIAYGYSMHYIDGKGLYFDFGYSNTTMILKTDDQKLIGNSSWTFGKIEPALGTTSFSGNTFGDLYLEGSYTQKGRAYSVENGTFEFYWRNAEPYGMQDTILKGKWTLKRL